MKPRVKSSFIAVLVALVVLLAAAVWGAVFAFPEPDASPDKAAQLQFHAQVAGWLMLGSIVLLVGAVGRLVWYWSREK